MSNVLNTDSIQPLDLFKEYKVKDLLESGQKDNLIRALAAKSAETAKSTPAPAITPYRTLAPYEDYATFDVRLIRVSLPGGEEKLVVEGSGEAGEAREVIDFPGLGANSIGATNAGIAGLIPPQAVAGQPLAAGHACMDYQDRQYADAPGHQEPLRCLQGQGGGQEQGGSRPCLYL